jgi:hypothetical protein
MQANTQRIRTPGMASIKKNAQQFCYAREVKAAKRTLALQVSIDPSLAVPLHSIERVGDYFPAPRPASDGPKLEQQRLLNQKHAALKNYQRTRRVFSAANQIPL